MALVVEDGSGLANATAYISRSFADSYHRARGNTAWAAFDSPTKEALILKATEFLDSEFYFMGEPTYPETPQALEWPRAGVFNENVVEFASDALPVALQRATAELALALGSTSDGGFASPVIEGNIFRRRERVGVVESETEGDMDVSIRFFPRVWNLIAPFVIGKKTGNGSAMLLRG
jgi:hypothetical protein